MWQALRLACEALLVSSDEETASVILDSANMQQLQTEKDGEAFTYDRLGFKYIVPLYCIYTPANLLRDPPAAAAITTIAAASAAAASASSGKTLQVQVAPNSTRAAASAAATVDVDASTAAASSSGTGKSLKFKVRFSNGLSDLLLDQRAGLTIGALKSLILSKHPSLISSDRCRIYYLGKKLAEQWSLGEVGLKKEMVLQCFVLAKDILVPGTR